RARGKILVAGHAYNQGIAARDRRRCGRGAIFFVLEVARFGLLAGFRLRRDRDRNRQKTSDAPGEAHKSPVLLTVVSRRARCHPSLRERVTHAVWSPPRRSDSTAAFLRAQPGELPRNCRRTRREL